MNGKILGFLVVGLTVGSLLAKIAPAQVVTIDPNNFGSGQVITAPGVTLQTETFGTIDTYQMYAPVLSPVYSYDAGCSSFPCVAVGTNVFAPSPSGVGLGGSGHVNGGFWGADASALQCAQNCMLDATYSNLEYLRLTFATPTDFVNTLAFSTGGDPTVITAFDSAGNMVGEAYVDVGSSYGWGYASITTTTSDISTVLIGGVDNYQGINEIAYAPEIDPTSAASGLTLLLGSLLVLRGRRAASSGRILEARFSS
jgi:hypothetical protein